MKGSWTLRSAGGGDDVFSGTEPDNPYPLSLVSNDTGTKYTRAARALPDLSERVTVEC